MDPIMIPISLAYSSLNTTNTTNEITVDQQITPLAIFVTLFDSFMFVVTLLVCLCVEFIAQYRKQRNKKRAQEETSKGGESTNVKEKVFSNSSSSDSSTSSNEETDQLSRNQNASVRTNIAGSSSEKIGGVFEQPPECQEFGMMKLIFYHNSPRGLVFLTMERFFVFMWYFLSVVLNHYVWINIFPKKNSLSHYQYLSNCVFIFSFGYYILIFILTISYYFDLHCEVAEGSFGIRIFIRSYLLEPCIYVSLVVLQIISVLSWIVTLLFGGLIVPYSYAEGLTLIFNYPVISIQVISTIFITVEVFLLSVLRYRCRHSVLLFTFAFGYYSWTTMLVKTRIIENYPYYGLMSYDDPDNGVVAMLMRYVVLIMPLLIFLCIWIMTCSRFFWVTKYWMLLCGVVKRVQIRRRLKRWFNILEQEQEQNNDDDDDDDGQNENGESSSSYSSQEEEEKEEEEEEEEEES